MRALYCTCAVQAGNTGKIEQAQLEVLLRSVALGGAEDGGGSASKAESELPDASRRMISVEEAMANELVPEEGAPLTRAEAEAMEAEHAEATAARMTEAQEKTDSERARTMPAIEKKAAQAQATLVAGGPAVVGSPSKIRLTERGAKAAVGRHEVGLDVKPDGNDHSQPRKARLEVQHAAARAIRGDYQLQGEADLDLGVIWRFKTFRLFPWLTAMQHSDHFMRVLFPIIFFAYVISMMHEVGWMSTHYALLQTSSCYVRDSK